MLLSDEVTMMVHLMETMIVDPICENIRGKAAQCSVNSKQTLTVKLDWSTSHKHDDWVAVDDHDDADDDDDDDDDHDDDDDDDDDDDWVEEEECYNHYNQN